MTARTLISVAPSLPLLGGSYLQFEAISPTTGLAITGVTVRNMVVYGSPVEADDVIGDLGAYMLVPGPAPLASSSPALPLTGGL